MPLHAKQKRPNALIQDNIATYINQFMSMYGGSGALLTAVQAATTIETLRAAFENLTALKAKDKHLARHVGSALQFAYDMKLFGTAGVPAATDAAQNTAIAALTTINTAAAVTDLLYLLCTSYDATLTSTYDLYSSQILAAVP